MAKKYELKFAGRPVGGIDGTASVYVTKVVEADDPTEAQLKAYETHEHIWGGHTNVHVRELQVEAAQ